MQKDGGNSSKPPHLTKTPPAPPSDKQSHQQQNEQQHQQQHQQQSVAFTSSAASDTYTEDEFVLIDWSDSETEGGATDLDASREFDFDMPTGCDDDRRERGEEQHVGNDVVVPLTHTNNSHLDGLKKRDWYQEWLRDKAVEKGDPWGFSSTGVSRTASPARSGARA